jgi:hypothetical protein
MKKYQKCPIFSIMLPPTITVVIHEYVINQVSPLKGINFHIVSTFNFYSRGKMT